MKATAKQNTELILHGDLKKAVLSLAVPIVINNFLQTMYNLTDAYWLKWIGTDSQAAISLVSPVQNIVVNFGQGITLAGAILISQYVGSRDRKNAVDMANHIFMFSMVFSVCLALLGFFSADAIVAWLKAEGNVAHFGGIYLKIVLLDLPFLFMINIFSAVRQAQGDTVGPVRLNLLGIILNMILDPLLMIGLKMGITGAALATLAAKVPCALIGYIRLVSKRGDDIGIDPIHFKFDPEKLKKVLRIGLPTAIGSSTMQFGFLLMTKNVLEFGDNAMAAYGIANRVNGLVSMPSNAVGSAVATIVGQNAGAGNMRRAEQAYKKARSMIVIFLFISGMILSRGIVSTGVVRIFSEDPAVIPMAADFLSIMAFWVWTNGIHNTTTGLLQGTGNTLYTMVNDAARLWVFRFATLFIFKNCFDMHERSVWYSVVVSNAISAFILWVLYRAGVWKNVIGREKHTAAEAAQ
ncbi:MAG: MATE family efflux transporter [Firmicutes bacterium]|nr:MATE family efflux transporter [Bacillota bacterium]